MPKKDEWTQVIPGKSVSEVKRKLLSINLQNAREGLPHVNILGESNGSVVLSSVSLNSVKKAKAQICPR